VNVKNIKLFIKLSRPLFLFAVAVLFALGVGIAHYLGVRINWEAYVLGQTWVTLLQLSTTYFNEYYNAWADRENTNRTYLTGGSNALGEGKLDPLIALIAALTTLAFLASLTVVLATRIQPPFETYLILFLAFIGSFFYSAPPLRLEASGYGELIVSVIVAFLVPLFAFILQAGSLHRLIAMTTFPLVFLHLGMLIVFELPDYATDLKFEKRTLVIRIGWQNGMILHNLLIIGAFLLLLLARTFGYPRFALLAGLLSIPIGLFQIFQMRNIASGAKPNWNLLTIGAASLFIITAYLLAFTFWTN
jgi:1,4-dihydroxy-2-naphthoate polyprenyltransferase